MSVANDVEVEGVDDGVEIPVHGGLDGHEAPLLGLSEREVTDVRPGERVDRCAERVGHLGLGVPPTLGEDLDAVVERGVVGGGHGDAVRAVEIAYRPHEHGRWHRPRHELHMDAVAGEHLGRPLGGLGGQESPVVAHDGAARSDPFGVHALGQPLGEQADVGLGEAVADDGAPATGAELDHGRSLTSRNRRSGRR